MKKIILSTLALGLLAAPALRADEALNLQDLDQRLKIAERKLEINNDNATAAKAGDATVSAGPAGFAITSADKNFALKFSALLQADSRNYLADDKQPQANDLLIRRARFIEQATLGPNVKLNLVWDLASDVLVDAFADIKLGSWASARVGQLKTPISLENWRSDPARDFVETGFSPGLTTLRDRGAWVEVADPDQIVSLGGGVFTGGRDGESVAGGVAAGVNAADPNDDKDAVAKLFLQPVRFFDTTLFRDFGFGVAASSGHRLPGSAITGGYKSTGQNTVTTYRTGTTVQDQSQRIAPQLYLFTGPFSVLSEYIRSTEFATNATNSNSVTGADYRVGILSREAWQVQAGWVITGEDSAFSGVKWNNETTNKDWGVWQLVARYQGFQVDDSNVSNRLGQSTVTRFIDPNTNATQIQGWGVGLNWIPQANTKVYLDFDQNLFTDGATQNAAGVYNGPTPTKTINRETENSLFARAQYSF